jgi:endonuclease I
MIPPGRRVAWLLSATLLVLATAPPAAVADPPPGYYDPAVGLSGAALRQALHEIVDDHLRYPYTSSATDTWDIVAVADEDPANPANVRTIYKYKTTLKEDHTQETGWNREHTWPNSYGFSQDGACNYPYTDCHQLMAADWSYNTARGNRVFDACVSGCAEYPVDDHPGLANWGKGEGNTGSWEVWENRKGDIARAMFYMDIRYEGDTHGITGCSEPDLVLTDNRALVVSDTSQNFSPAYMGVLSTLIEWHLGDPVDDRERRRNDVVFGYQGNRNPFVDHPEWVCEIWSCTGGDTTPPDAPTGLAAWPADCAVFLDWDDNLEPDLAGYEVYRAESPSGPFERLNGPLVPGSEFDDTSAENGLAYWYFVTAVDLSGNESDPSLDVSEAPNGTGPCGGGDGSPWINEFHYDNSGTDTGEMIEVAGPSGLDLGGWSLVGYNGNGGAVYKTVALSGTIPNQQNGFGTASFPFLGLQNGSPDAMALVDANQNVVQFLSYEGTLTAVDGPAAGMTSTDVGVSEPYDTPIGYSLQLGGSGSRYEDFVWEAAAPNTAGLPNRNQSFEGPAIARCQGIDGIRVLTVLSGGIDTEQDYVAPVEADQSIELQIVRPGGLGNGKFIVHLNAGEPDDSTLTLLPAQLGEICFPILIDPYGTANPSAVWNALGKELKVGASRFFEVPIPDPARAPVTFYSAASVDPARMPVGSRWTLQGIVLNPEATSPKGGSVTNAIVLEVR